MTQFDFDSARVTSDGELCLKVKNIPAARQFVYSMKNRVYLRDCKTEVNPVYSMGFPRCGCIGCPMAGPSRYTEFRVWPAYEKLYRRAFQRMLEAREAKGKPSQWKSSDEVWRWWMEDENLDGQLDIFGGEVGGPERQDSI